MTDAKEQRMILAGRYMLHDGLSLKQALMKAGYSEQTARCPAANGISAKQCTALALKADGTSAPAALRISARELLQKKLDAGLDDPDKVSLTAAARAAETIEKVYGDTGEGEDPPPRSFAERADWFFGLLAEMQRRGLDAPVDAVVIDAELVEGESNLELPAKE